MPIIDLDTQVRLAAIHFIEERLRARADPVMTWQELSREFTFRAQRVALIGASGIWKPSILDLPISACTAPPKANRPAPYKDRAAEDGVLLYCYRGEDPQHRDNRGLRELMRQRKPLIYLSGIARGRYCVFCPVYVVHDDPRALTFSLQVDVAGQIATEGPEVAEAQHARRAYVTTSARRRIHQASFRQRVLDAYRSHCAICRLGHEELLDAAHIIPDREERGEPLISNGLALCKIHHAAFDNDLIGIDPDLRIHVRHDLLEEGDGPMLVHGIQEVHGRKLLVVPRLAASRPSPDRLAERFERFRMAR